MKTVCIFTPGRVLKGSFYEAELRKVALDESKLPKEPIVYNHVRDNDFVTEIYTVLPGEKSYKWHSVESLYPYYPESDDNSSNQRETKQH